MQNNLRLDFLKRIRLATKKKHNLKLHEPKLFNDFSKVKECIKNNFVAKGKYIQIFENELKKFTKSKYVIGVSSGTAGLHLALKSLGIKNNEEVLVPALTFVATANVIKYINAIPHFIDSDEKNLGVDAEKLKNYLNSSQFIFKKYLINKKSKRKVTALIVTHVFGHIGEIIKLKKLCKKYNLKLIEDATEALGSKFLKKHAGTFGDIGVLSFNGNKIITTGGGGAILTNKLNLFNKARHLAQVAKKKHEYEFIHDELGYNYRIPNINAALGCSQLKRLNTFIKKKRKLFSNYNLYFSNVKYLSLFKEPKNCKSNYWLQTVILKKKFANFKYQFIKFSKLKNIETRPVWKLLSNLKYFKNCPSMNLDNSKSLEKRIINIPSNEF